MLKITAKCQNQKFKNPTHYFVVEWLKEDSFHFWRRWIETEEWVVFWRKRRKSKMATKMANADYKNRLPYESVEQSSDECCHMVTKSLFPDMEQKSKKYTSNILNIGLSTKYLSIMREHYINILIMSPKIVT